MAPAAARPDRSPSDRSCGDWLTVLDPYLTEPLFQPSAVARLRRLAAHLPADCAGIFELRLNGSGIADLSLRLKKPSQARALAERLSLPHLASFLRTWAEPEGSFRPLHSVWLEFDLDQEPAGLPVPVVCAKLRPTAERGWILDTLIPALQGGPMSPAQRRRTDLCLQGIAAPAVLLYVFSLRSRNSDAVRLEILGLDPGGIREYLRRVHPEAVAWTEETAGLFTGVERVHLSLDIGSGTSESEILPRIGIEGSFSRLPRREPRWRELFDRLVARGLCPPEKREAALAWPGYDSIWTAPDRWPLPPARESFCLRNLSHVKVVCRPDRAPEAKVYLMFGPLAASSPASRSTFAA